MPNRIRKFLTGSSFLAPDMGIEIEIKADFGDGQMTVLDIMIFKDGVLKLRRAQIRPGCAGYCVFRTL